MKKIKIALCTFIIFLFATGTIHAQDHLTEEIQAIVDQLTLKLNSNTQIKTIAVADFTNLSGVPTALGKYLSEEFSIALANAKSSFTVIDRSRINALLKEAGLEVKGLLDPEASAKLGKLKGIDVIIIGTLTADGNDIRATVKAIKLESATIVAAARGQISRTPSMSDLEAKELNANTDTSSTVRPISPNNKIKSIAQQKVEMGGCLFELLECKQTNQQITCTIRITSTSKDLDLQAYFSNTRIIDATTGYENNVSLVKIADISSNSSYAKKSLVAGYPITSIFTFSGIAQKVDVISKMEIGCWDSIEGNFLLSFRNISVKQ